MSRSTLVTTAAGDLLCEDAGGRPVHRVGFEPEPWSWTPWQYAEHGRFSGRWDDPDGIWRSIYVGESRLACFLEVLAFARPDPQLQDELAGVDEADEDAVAYPTVAGGLLPESWRSPRRVGTARLTGWYAVPGDKESLPTLRARFLALAITLRLPDVDAGVIRLAEPREFTQVVAAWLYDQTAPDRAPLAGVQFASRHGDDLTLWPEATRPGLTATLGASRRALAGLRPVGGAAPNLIRHCSRVARELEGPAWLNGVPRPASSRAP